MTPKARRLTINPAAMSKFNENLSSHERAVLPLVVDILRSRTGRGHEVSSQMIISAVRRIGYHISGIEVRHIVNHIRVNAVIPCLASNGNGYHVALTREDMDDCISSLRGRVESIKEVIAALTAQRDVRFS